MLAIAAGKFIFSAVMAPVRIFVFCLFITLYIPCLATFGVIVRDLVRSGGGHRGIHHRCGAHRWWDCISGAHLHAFDKKGEAIRLPFTFSKLAGLPTKIYQTVHEGALAFLVVISPTAKASESPKSSALTWRRSPVRIRSNQSRNQSGFGVTLH